MRSHLLCMVFLAGQLFGAELRPASMPASQPAATGKPTCAVLADSAMGLDRSPVVALVETKLSSGGRVRLVERATFQDLVSERQLQDMLAPQAAAQRIALGRLIKADLLIVVRADRGGEGQPIIRTVVCETAGGLRIHRSSTAWSDDPEGDAQALATHIEDAVQKSRAPVRHVVATPPFTGSDFLHKYDHLQGLYSQEVEDTLSSCPGVIVVELAEARAISNELAVAGPELAVSRRMPLYVMGEYNVAATSAGDTAGLRISLRKADRTLAEIHREALSVVDSIQFVRSATRDLLTTISEAQPGSANPAEEVEQLCKRARSFRDTGDIGQAVSLVEAALLRQPRNPALHEQFVQLAGTMVTRLNGGGRWGEAELSPGSPKGDYQLRATLALHYFRLGLEHTETWIRLVDLREVRGRELIDIMLAGFYAWRKHNPVVPEELDVCREFDRLFQERCQMIRRMLELKIAAGQINERTIVPFFCNFGPRLNGPRESVELRQRFIEMVQNVPGAARAIMAAMLEEDITLDSYPVLLTPRLAEGLRDPETQARIDALARMPGAEARNAANQLRELAKLKTKLDLTPRQRAFERENCDRGKTLVPIHYKDGNQYVTEYVKRGNGAKERRFGRQAAEAEVTFERIELQRQKTSATESGVEQTLIPISGWLPCPDGIDVVWSPSEIFVMKSKGILTSIYRCADNAFQDTANRSRIAVDEEQDTRSIFSFDGRYVWAPAPYSAEPHLVVFDPRTERVFRFTTADGLPPMGPLLCAAGVGPGVACVASSFGRPDLPEHVDRTWCAMVELTPSGTLSVKPVLELQRSGPEDVRPIDKDQGLSRFFLPLSICALKPDTSMSAERVLLFRGSVRRPLNPLLIDPATRAVTVASARLSHAPSHLRQIVGDEIFFLGHMLRRARLPDLAVDSMPLTLGQPEPLGNRQSMVWAPGGAPPYTFSVHDKTLVILAQRSCWVGGCCRSPQRPLAGKLPDDLSTFCDMVVSNHYGLLVLAGEGSYPLWPVKVSIKPSVLREAAVQGATLAEEAAEERAGRLARAQGQEETHAAVDREQVRVSVLAYLLSDTAIYGAFAGLIVAAVLVLYWVGKRSRRRVQCRR